MLPTKGRDVSGTPMIRSVKGRVVRHSTGEGVCFVLRGRESLPRLEHVASGDAPAAQDMPHHSTLRAQERNILDKCERPGMREINPR